MSDVDVRRAIALLRRRVRSGRLMFPFVDETWNPIVGCDLGFCVYCWRRAWARRIKYNMELLWKPTLIRDRLKKRFKPSTVVFTCTMGDIFSWSVLDEWVEEVFEVIRRHPDTLFLVLTKNPARFLRYDLPPNVLAGTTAETDLDEVRGIPYSEISRAPPPRERLRALADLDHPLKFVSVEPILDFSSPEEFAEKIAETGAIAVAVGYDNHRNRLPEPPLDKTVALIAELEKRIPVVVRKSLRRAWFEE